MNENLEIKDILKELAGLADEWDDLSMSEQTKKLEELAAQTEALLSKDEGEKKKEPVTLTEDEEKALSGLSVVSMLMDSFIRDSLPIPGKMVDYYNDRLKTLYGINEDSMKFAEKMFDENVGRFEEIAIDHIRSSLKDFNGENKEADA